MKDSSFIFDPCEDVADHLLNRVHWSAPGREWRPEMTSNAASAQSNVIQLQRTGAATRRLNIVDGNVDGELANFLKKLNTSMHEKAGVSYISIRTSLHGDNSKDAIRSYMDDGYEAEDAASHIMQLNGLKSVNGKVPVEVVAAYNKVQAAISEFVAQAEGWHRSDDGRIFAVVEDTVAFLKPVRYRKDSPNEPEAYGFGIEMREDAEVDHIEGRIIREGSLGERFAGWDLAKPLEAMQKHIASREAVREFTF